MTIEAVVFDMDGVIVDSEPVWQRIREELVADLGGTWTSTDGDRCRGRPSEVWSTMISRRVGGAMNPDEVFEEVLSRMMSSYEWRLPLFPGAIESIISISEEYTIAVASGSPSGLIDTVLERSGLDSVCAAIGYGDNVAEGKPAPDIYLDVLQLLEVEPSRAVGVEDSLAGLQAVQAAGMQSVAVVAPGYSLPLGVLKNTQARVNGLGELTVGIIDAIGREVREVIQ